jgi:hypothetical protein
VFHCVRLRVHIWVLTTVNALDVTCILLYGLSLTFSHTQHSHVCPGCTHYKCLEVHFQALQALCMM